jgi:hypothetical protein
MALSWVFVGHAHCELSDTIVDFAGKRPIHTARTTLVRHFISWFCRLAHGLQYEA